MTEKNRMDYNTFPHQGEWGLNKEICGIVDKVSQHG